MTRGQDAAAERCGDTVAIDGGYQHRARTRGMVVQRFWHWEKERLVRKFSAPARGDRAIDVGCGSGVIADLLAQLGARTTGVDGNPSAIAYAKSTFARENLDFHLARVEDLPFEPGTIDRIYCLELIEHLYEPQVRSLLELFARLARPDGVLTLTTPNFRGLWPAVEFAMDRLKLAPQMDEHQHVTHFHRESLRAMLASTGWAVERLATFSTIAPFASLAGWGLAEGLADVEDRMDLPFGNILAAIARRAPVRDA